MPLGLISSFSNHTFKASLLQTVVIPVAVAPTILNWNFNSPSVATNNWAVQTYTSTTNWTLTTFSGSTPVGGQTGVIYLCNGSAQLDFNMRTLPSNITQYVSIQTAAGYNKAILTQALTFTTAGNFVLTYSVCPRNPNSYTQYKSSQQIMASINGYTVTSSVTISSQWSNYSLSFTIPSAGSYNLAFTSATTDTATSILLSNIVIIVAQ